MMRKGITVLVLLIGVYVVTNFFWRRVDMWRFPWAYAQSGNPTLTGTWVGSLTTATGQHRGVIMEMHLPDISGRKRKVRRTRYGSLEGTARTCDERGEIRSLTLSGNPHNKDATQLHLMTIPAENPPLDGLTLNTAKGLWDQGNTLHMQAGFYFRKGTGAISGPEYPDTQKEALLHMTRGGDAEFRRACDAIRGKGA
jgi:hypothetical protein